MKRADITPELIRELLDCDYKTGKLTWRERGVEWFDHCKRPDHACRAWNSRHANKAALTHVNKQGYEEGTVLGFVFRAHTIVWAHRYGAWPVHGIDHIKGKEAGNCVANLRDVPQSVNGKNTKKHSTNTSGHPGVSWDAKNRKWGAYIKVEGRQIRLGRFIAKRDAIGARKAAEREFGFHENHGR